MKLHVPDAGGDGVDRTRPTREQLGQPTSLSTLGEPDTFGVSRMLDVFRRSRHLQVNEAIVGHASRVQQGNAENS